MSLLHVNARHLGLIGRNAAYHTVRGGAGIMFLLMALVFGLFVAQIILTPVEMMMSSAAREGHPLPTEEVLSQIINIARPIVRWMVGGKLDLQPPSVEDLAKAATSRTNPAQTPLDRWAAFLLDDRPALMSAILLILMFGVPLLVPVLAFNQTSGDIQSRGLRYLLLRTERANIFFGRFLGTVVFSIAVLGFIVAIITSYLNWRLRIYHSGPLWGWSFHGFLALVLTAVPYIALCASISASVSSPFLSLITSSLIIGGVPLFAWLGALKWNAVGLVKLLTPWGVQQHLLHPEASHVAGAAVLCIVYTAVYLLIGRRYFERRDL